jgi:hypothetical protein
MQPGRRGVSWLRLGLGWFLLNFALTIQNIWPTPWITTHNKFSFEIALLLLVLAVYAELKGVPPRRLIGWLAVGLTLLTIGRYAQVTAPALYGRPINLYWDAQHLPRVAAMLAQVSPTWLVALAALGTMVLVGGLFLALRWALGSVWAGLSQAGPRRGMAVLAAGVAAIYLAAPGLQLHTGRWFSNPVMPVYARQAEFLWEALIGDAQGDTPRCKTLPASDLARLAGADVLLIFLESYGAVAYDRPAFNAALAASRERLADAARRTQRGAVSAYLESPTFGGSSWLAHSSLLTGVEVREPQSYHLLLTRECDTLPDRFARQGYRTLGLMPGLRYAWPEGDFYGFQHILGESILDYRGPEFGWWRIPDQYAIARLDQLEISVAQRPPLFVFYPTISSHTPFRPTPPYQADWDRMLTQQPFEAGTLEVSLTRPPDWTDLGPAYTDALNYAFTWLAGYLEKHADSDLVIIVLGDHQPPASVSGASAPWEVPVHVITQRTDILESLQSAGLQPGLEPGRPTLGPMHELSAALLTVFDSGETSPRSASNRSVPVSHQSGVDIP